MIAKRKMLQILCNIESDAATKPDPAGTRRYGIPRIWSSHLTINSRRCATPPLCPKSDNCLAALRSSLLRTRSAAPMQSLKSGARVRSFRRGMANTAATADKEPNTTAKGLFLSLNTGMSNQFKPGEIRILWRQVSDWRKQSRGD